MKLIKYIKKVNPDLIHIHNLHGYYLDIDILFNFLKSFNKPVVMTLHDCWTFTGHCVYFDYIGCNKWKTQCFKCPQKNTYPKSILFDNSKFNFQAKKVIFNSLNKLYLVTPSEWLSTLVKSSFLKNHPISVINNGIDLEVFKSSGKLSFINEISVHNKFIILGVASQWSERKGLKYFIELANKLNDDYLIVMIGVDKKLTSTLPKNIVSMIRTENISQLVKYYSTADVFLNPTLEDNFPTVNIEALACGTPVITFKTGGSIEIIDNFTGVISDEKSSDSLVKSIEEVKTKGKNFYSTNCRKRALEKYDKIKQFSLYIDFYKRALSNEVSSNNETL
jgi:glycosyltransferase involved in cell wall biosynthesis